MARGEPRGIHFKESSWLRSCPASSTRPLTTCSSGWTRSTSSSFLRRSGLDRSTTTTPTCTRAACTTTLGRSLIPRLTTSRSRWHCTRFTRRSFGFDRSANELGCLGEPRGRVCAARGRHRVAAVPGKRHWRGWAGRAGPRPPPGFRRGVPPAPRLRIVVGVTGGIAAYKAVFLVRGFVLDGHDVHVVPTAAALPFLGLPTWEAISRNPVNTDPFDDVAEVRHVALGQSADLIVIAPATANSLAKLATGLADDLLGTTVLASEAPLVIAPAMHREMWENAATQANIATLRARGHTVVGPGDGQLTGDDRGVGRMSEPTEIAAA